MREIARRVNHDRAERLWTLGVWLIASVALFAYLGYYGRNVPYFEDWTLVPVLTGGRPASLSWLLEMTVAEHRFILAKALLFPMWRASGGDFRASLVFSGALLSALAFACVAVARRLRGRAAFADAVFPLTLLSISHSENVLFFIQVFFVIPVTLVTMLVLLIASGRWTESVGRTSLLCLGLILMPGNAGIGMLVVPPLLAWFAYAAWWRRRTDTRDGQREAVLLLAAIGVTVVLACLYFVGYQPQQTVPAVPRTWENVGVTAIQVLSLALGAGGRELWAGLGSVVAAACVLTACALGYIAAKRPDERLRATGILACLVATCLLAAGVGYGRATIGPGAGLPARYALLMAPALICIVLTAIIYGGSLVGPIVQALVFGAACAMIIPNAALGLEYGQFRAALADAVLADIESGVPPAALAQRYWRKLSPDYRALDQGFALLSATKQGPFAGMPASAAVDASMLHEVPVPVTVVGTHDATFVDGVAHGSGPDPYIVLTLTKRMYVVGIRIRFTLETEGGGPADFQAYWMLSGRNNFDPVLRNAIIEVSSGPRQQTVTFWIYDTVDHLRLDPDVGASVFRPTDVVLLTRD
jgi:hypothetical protein